MSLQNYVYCLSTENLKVLHDDLVNAGVAYEGKGEWKSIFADRQKESSGKRKKLYSALRKVEKHEIDSLLNVLVELYPRPNTINSGILITR